MGLSRLTHVAAGLLLTGCSLFTSKNANTVLDGAQLTCVFNSAVTQEQELAKVCDVAQELIPLLRKLVAQREASRKVGVSWEVQETRTAAPPPQDAGRD